MEKESFWLIGEGGIAVLTKQQLHWCGEYLFVFTALLILKVVLFPLVLWWWFTPGDLPATLQEMTLLIFSVIGIVLLVALGSISRHRYRLTFLQLVTAFFVLNAPLLLASFIPATAIYAVWWWRVIGDGVQLWWPDVTTVVAPFMCLVSVVVVCAGRHVYVRDERIAPLRVRDERVRSVRERNR
ncbi:hypothetical protein [Numidum massiliense]|uniref:hypothetical protein n=1 Tax=Numidum massiliense TaxID=1522315 RepID=UPI00164D00AD|nr:hypothetical protein [Numidum massiliense]